MAQRRTRQSILNEVSQLVKAAYLNERAHWYAQRSRNVGDLRGDDLVWQKMAKFVLDNKIDNYIAFISMQFVAGGNTATCPPPTRCYGPAALQRWNSDADRERKAAEAMGFDLQFYKEHMLAQLREARAIGVTAGWSEDETDRYVLLDETNQLSMLFRHCMAVKTNRADIAEMYVQSATRDYLLSRDLYDKVWGDLIPEEIRASSAQFTLAGYTTEE